MYKNDLFFLKLKKKFAQNFGDRITKLKYLLGSEYIIHEQKIIPFFTLKLSITDKRFLTEADNDLSCNGFLLKRSQLYILHQPCISSPRYHCLVHQ